MPTAIEGLEAARELISDEARWTSGTFARAVDGTPSHPSDPEACRWCAHGAIRRTFDRGTGPVGSDPEYAHACSVLDAAARELYGANSPAIEMAAGSWSYIGVNDVLGHRAVLQVYDRAIARLKASSRPRSSPLSCWILYHHEFP